MARGVVVVAGATGFLGSHLCRGLLADGYDVVGLKRRTSDTARIDALAPRLRVVDVESDGFEELVEGVRDVTAIVNAATNYGRHGESREVVFDANYRFPRELLVQALEWGIATFVNSDTVLPPGVDAYSDAKRRFVDDARRLVEPGGPTRFVNMRLENVYGPGDAADKFVTAVVRACAADVPTLRLTRGEQRRDFVFVDDAVGAYLRVLANRDALTAAFTEFQVGTGCAVRVRDFVELIHRLTDSRTRLDFGAVPYRPNELMFSQADVEALTALGWRCCTPPERGVRSVLEEVRT